MQTSERTDPNRYAGRHRTVDHRTPSVAGYDLVGPLARGGSGTVWSATDASGAPVAVKVVPAADAEGALVELAVLRRIRDPHLVRMHEAIALPSGEVALVLDHLGGGTVGSVVRARGHLRTGEVVTVLTPIASTLARLHGVGVVHGDVSPDNVLLDLEGRPFLSDLGVAHITGDRCLELRGTEGFVAPEVALGQPPTASSDVHGLGALAWFCLTGEAPGPPVVRGRLSDRVPDLPPALVDAVEGALRAGAEDRPDADELALALFESATAEPVTLAWGGDDVSLLTRRIRTAARAETPGSSRARAPVLVRLRPLLRPGSGARRVCTGLVAATVVALGAAWSAGGRPEAADPPVGAVRPASGAVPSAGAGAGASGGGLAGAGSGSDLRLAADAPTRDPVALVRALAQARARAWSTGVAARLVEVDAPGSPALARDTEVLARAQRAGQRYVGLDFVVREAAVVGEVRGVVTVRTRIDTGAHVVRSAAREEQRPAVSADPVLLDLVRTRSGWRVHDVRSP